MRPEAKRTDSDSKEQRTAETAALARLARKLGLPPLQSNHRIPVGEAFVSVDGFHLGAKSVTLVEVNAHCGRMKTATRNKVMKDAFKMLVVSKLMARCWRGKKISRVLVFVDDDARASFGPKSWGDAAFSALGIEAHVCRVSRRERKALQAAQRRQDLRFNR